MDTKKYTIVIDGVKEAIENVKSLKEVIDSVSDTVTASAKVEKEAATAKKTAASATDELGKVQLKLNQYDAAYATEVAKAKNQLKSKNDEVKNALKQEQDLSIIEEASMNTYKEKQTYLSALNRVIRNMTEAEEVNGKTKQDLIKISAEVQQALKDEDEQMKIYVRNVGNYKSATEDLEKPTMSLKQELKSLKGELAKLLLEGVSPTDEAFLALAERAGAIKDAIGDAGAEVSQFASDTHDMDSVINVLTTITASYGLLISTMQAFGIENDAVVEGIQKLQAVQTALNSLNALSNSLLDNSTMSYKLYHTVLQAVGLEKKVSVASTTALTAAETAETAATTAGTVANTSFAASLWAILSPLLLITAAVAVAVAGFYGLVAAYEALFGPTAEETAAMEAEVQKMQELNDKTQENIEIMKAKGANDAQVLQQSLQMYSENVTALAAHVEKCKEFYGEDSDEYKNAVEKKKEAEKELQKLQLDGLTYLEKVLNNYRETEKKNTLGLYKYKKQKAKEEYEYQVKLLNELVKQGRIATNKQKAMAAELAAAYKQALAEVDKEEAKSTSSKTKISSTSRGLGTSSKKESEAEKAAKEFKKAEQEFSKTIASLQDTLNNALVKGSEDELAKLKKQVSSVEVITKEQLDKKIELIKLANEQEVNLITQKYNLEKDKDEQAYKELQEKYKGHTKKLREYADLHNRLMNIKETEHQKKLGEVKDEANKEKLEAEKDFNIKYNLQQQKTFELAKNTAVHNISAMFEELIKASESDLDLTYQMFKDYLPKITDETEKAGKSWREFLALKPDEITFEPVVKKAGDELIKMFDKMKNESTQLETILNEVVSSCGETATHFQFEIMQIYYNGLNAIKAEANAMIEQGKDQEEVLTKMATEYENLKNQIYGIRSEITDFASSLNLTTKGMDALGNTTETVDTRLTKWAKHATKMGSTMKKVVSKYIEPFKDAFDAVGETINSVFDAMNDWLQVDIDKLADALDEITEKYDDLSDAVENTEDTISSLKDEFKSASSSDKTVLAQKIADEETLLAQEKAAQQEAYNEQVKLDEQKQELENEQAKRQLEQQQVSAGISLINALISTAEGMSKEYSKGILGIPTAVLIGVLGGIQVAAITAQIAALQAQKSRYAEGGYVNDDGMLQGARHSEGGIDIKVGKKGRIIEAEGGEFIINRKSSARYYDLLTDINNYGKTGKEISGLNRKKFAKGGSLNFERVNDTLGDSKTEKQMQRMMENITITPKVSVVDIIKKTNDYNRVRAYAGR